MRLMLGVAASVLLGVTLTGCGGTDQVEVEGTVTYDGQPVPAGSIAFLAADSQSPNTGGTILEGKYRVPAEVGPKPGRHRVEIRWAKPNGQSYRGETGAMLNVTAEGLPARYNDESELTVDLKPGKNTCDFSLEK